MDLPEYEVTDLGIVSQIAGWVPETAIHAAAVTDVDGCEREPEAAYRVNALGTRKCGAGL